MESGGSVIEVTRSCTIDAGANVLVVPRGALSSNVRISMGAPRDSVNSVRFYPEGLHFAAGRPAVLTMSYANCSLLARLAPKKIVYTSEGLRILDILLSLDNILRKTVSAPVEHSPATQWRTDLRAGRE